MWPGWKGWPGFGNVAGALWMSRSVGRLFLCGWEVDQDQTGQDQTITELDIVQRIAWRGLIWGAGWMC